MLFFASFWDRFWKPILFVLRFTFGALGEQQVTKMSSKIDAKIEIDKGKFRGRPTAKDPSELVARRVYSLQAR